MWHDGGRNLMATLTQRLPYNVPGLFYVDDTCTDCDLCRTLMPAGFMRNDETGYSFVHRQPQTEQEMDEAREALSSCPTESIGDDGVAA